jgi:hypothetical protein
VVEAGQHRLLAARAVQSDLQIRASELHGDVHGTGTEGVRVPYELAVPVHLELPARRDVGIDGDPIEHGGQRPGAVGEEEATDRVAQGTAGGEIPDEEIAHDAAVGEGPPVGGRPVLDALLDHAAGASGTADGQLATQEGAAQLE